MSVALAEVALLNTSIPFQNLHKALYPITRSLPLILHHKQTIADILIKALSIGDRVDLALSAPHIIDLIPSFIQCLTPDPDFKQLQLDTILTPLVRAIVSLAVDPPSIDLKTGGDRGNDPSSPVEISKRAFQVLAWTFRQVGDDLVNSSDNQIRHQAAWSWVLEGLNGSKPLVEVPLEESVEDSLSKAADATFDLDEEAGNGDERETQGGFETVDSTNNDQETAVESGDFTAETEVEAMEADDTESTAEESDALHPTPISSSRRRPLSSTKPHLRRLLATCFSFLLRRAKSGERLDSIAQIILGSLQTEATHDLCQSIAWLILESIKSVEHHIHSRGSAILRAFIRQACKLKIEPAIPVLCAALTGLVHHGKLETLSSISEVVMTRLNNVAEAEALYEKTLTLELVRVLSGTRRGSRLSEKDKASVINMLETSWSDINRESSMYPLAVETATFALLGAPSLQTMLDSGRKLLDRIWTVPAEVSLSYPG